MNAGKPQLPAAQRQTKLSAFTQPKSKQPDPAPVPSRADRAAQGPEGAKVAELAAAVDVEGEEGKFGDEELAAAARDMGLTRCEFQGAGNEKATRSLKEAVLFYESFLDEVVAASEDELPSSSPGRRYDPARCSLDSLADWLEDATHSSAFSGIAAPETALLGFHHALQARLPKRKALPWAGG